MSSSSVVSARKRPPFTVTRSLFIFIQREQKQTTCWHKKRKLHYQSKQPARVPLLPANISQQHSPFLTEQPVGVITGPWPTAFSSQFQEFSVDMLFKSGLSNCWAGVFSLSKHSLFSLAFSLFLTKGAVCLSLCETHRYSRFLTLCLSLSLCFSLTHTVLQRDSKQMGGWTILSNNTWEGHILHILLVAFRTE